MDKVKIAESNNSCSIALCWEPPFSLNVTNVDRDVWYSLNITCLDTSDAVPVPCDYCDNLSEPFYLFTRNESTSCTKYSFTITAYNEIGPGTCKNNLTCMSILYLNYCQLLNCPQNTTQMVVRGARAIRCVLPRNFDFRPCFKSVFH